MTKKSITLDTPVGNFTLLLNNNNAVVAAGFYNSPSILPPVTDATVIKKYQTAINNYFAGDYGAFSKLRFELTGSSFQKKFWHWLYSTLPGKNYSYKEAASAIGHPGAARAIGSACKNNPIALIIPCHRIVKSDGTMGEYAFGKDIKKKLLQHENNNN